MRFEFATAAKIVFGAGTLREVPSLASRMGRHALVLTGKNPERAQGLVEGLRSAGMEITSYSIPREPTTDMVSEGAGIAVREGCGLVIAIGGGSVIDAGKAISVLMANTGDVFDFLEVVGRAHTITNHPAPFIAIPTTAGTGTEVTKNAVIISKEHRVKVSMRSELMLPRLVVVDPELTYSMTPEVTASTGLDALTQLIEAFVTRRANPMTDCVCREGLIRAAASLERAYEDGRDEEAREGMSIASLFSGIVLANAGLGAVHGFAAPIGGSFEAPHGLVCARLLPLVMEANIRALQEKSPGSSFLKRYDEIAGILTGNEQALASEGIEWVVRLCSRMGIPPLSSIGMSREDIPDIVSKAMRASSMKGNPVELGFEELSIILERAI